MGSQEQHKGLDRLRFVLESIINVQNSAEQSIKNASSSSSSTPSLAKGALGAAAAVTKAILFPTAGSQSASSRPKPTASEAADLTILNGIKQALGDLRAGVEKNLKGMENNPKFEPEPVALTAVPSGDAAIQQRAYAALALAYVQLDQAKRLEKPMPVREAFKAKIADFRETVKNTVVMKSKIDQVKSEKMIDDFTTEVRSFKAEHLLQNTGLAEKKAGMEEQVMKNQSTGSGPSSSSAQSNKNIKM